MLREVLKVIIHELKCLPKKRIEWLSGCSLTNGQGRDDMDGYQGMSAHRILLFHSQVQKVVVLHRLGTLLKQARRIVEINGDCEA